MIGFDCVPLISPHTLSPFWGVKSNLSEKKGILLQYSELELLHFETEASATGVKKNVVNETSRVAIKAKKTFIKNTMFSVCVQADGIHGSVFSLTMFEENFT